MCFLEVQNQSISNTLGLCSLDNERFYALKTAAMAYNFIVYGKHSKDTSPQMILLSPRLN